MKILLRFYLQNNKLPIDYRRIMLSFFKRSLSDIAEGKYYEKYYFTPERRNFTFAVNLPMPKFSKTEIQLGKNQLNITFSTADYNTGCIFMSAFIKQKDKPIPAPLGNEMKLVSVNLVPEKNVTSSSAVVKMLSPLCILSLIHISEPTRLGMISYAVFCLKKKKNQIASTQSTSIRKHSKTNI